MDSSNKEQKGRYDLRSRIIEAAVEAFGREGIKNVRMDDIANGLSISKRTLYEIFHDKEELLFECVRHRQQEQFSYLQGIINDSDNVLEVVLKYYLVSLEALQKINCRYFQEMKKYPSVCEYLQQCRQNEAQKTEDYYQKGVKQGIFRGDINFRIFHRLMSGQLDMLMDGKLFAAYSLVEVFNIIVMVNMRGISTEKGHKILDDFLLNNK